MIRRMIGAAKLSNETFEEVEADSSATVQAMLVVVIVAVATGIGALGTGELSRLILGIIVGLAGWALWAWLTFFIGTKLLGTPDTDADWGQLARSLGFAQGNRVLTKEHLEEVVLDPTGFKPFTLDTPFESGFLLQHIEGNLA